MPYIDQQSFHYNNEFKHIKTISCEDDVYISMFANNQMECVIEKRAYSGGDISISQSKMMEASLAQKEFESYLN